VAHWTGRVVVGARHHALGISALVIALGGTSYAVTTDGGAGRSGRLHACVTKQFKTLHLVRSDEPCPDGQRRISWNKRGPRGKRGPSGLAGPVGATGATGTRGLAGPVGATGAAGATGATGTEGPTGPQGVPGSPPALAFGEVAAQITSPTGGYGTDPSSPGPSVTVDVPDAGPGTGFVQVWAQVHANESSTAVGLFDVTGGGNVFVSGQDTVCPDRVTALPPGTLPGDLFITPDNDGTGVEGDYGPPMVASQGIADCSATAGPPGPVLIEVTAGTRTFRLEYADCGCGGTPTVSDRRLWIAPQPTS
jgi:collagen triple helix repeat protein